MATYEEFLNQAQADGLINQFSSADLELARRNPNAGLSILSYKKDYNNATTDEARALANAGANSIRNTYGGYDAGTDGADYALYGSPSSFSTQYTAQKDKLLANLLDRKEFEYDLESDPMWDIYKDQYTRAGQQAMEDTLGKVSAATGGLASSYASTASAQAYNDYMQELNSIIPTLEQNAYNRYLNEYNLNSQTLNTLMDVDNTDYNRFLDQINYETNQTATEKEELATKQEFANSQIDAILEATHGDISAISAELMKDTSYDQSYIGALANYYKEQWLASQAQLYGSSSYSTGSGGSGGRGYVGSGGSSGGSSFASLLDDIDDSAVAAAVARLQSGEYSASDFQTIVNAGIPAEELKSYGYSPNGARLPQYIDEAADEGVFETPVVDYELNYGTDYDSYLSRARSMKNSGSSDGDIVAMLSQAQKSGKITSAGAMRIKNQLNIRSN